MYSYNEMDLWTHLQILGQWGCYYFNHVVTLSGLLAGVSCGMHNKTATLSSSLCSSSCRTYLPSHHHTTNLQNVKSRAETKKYWSRE